MTSELQILAGWRFEFWDDRTSALSFLFWELLFLNASLGAETLSERLHRSCTNGREASLLEKSSPNFGHLNRGNTDTDTHTHTHTHLTDG